MSAANVLTLCGATILVIGAWCFSAADHSGQRAWGLRGAALMLVSTWFFVASLVLLVVT